MTTYDSNDIISATNAGPLLGLASARVPERLKRMGVPLIKSATRTSDKGNVHVIYFVRVADIDAARGTPAHLAELDAINKHRIKLGKLRDVRDIHGNRVPVQPKAAPEAAPAAPEKKTVDILADLSERLVQVERWIQMRDFRIAQLAGRVGDMQERLSSLLASLGEAPITRKVDDTNGSQTHA